MKALVSREKTSLWGARSHRRGRDPQRERGAGGSVPRLQAAGQGQHLPGGSPGLQGQRKSAEFRKSI